MDAAAALVLLVSNVIYGTSYAVSRVALDEIPPVTLAFLRLVIGGLVLWPFARGPAGQLSRHDAVRIAWMGGLGFAAAFALALWGLAASTATSAALLIVVEPASIIVLGALLLGERLSRREALGAAVALGGTVLVVLDGVPALGVGVARWRGDLLIVLSGLAYAAYSLIGRDVVRRVPPVVVTARSIVWGAVTLLPLAALEIRATRAWPGPGAVAATLYLGAGVTGLAFVLWNRGLAAVSASRAAVFINVQPVVGAALGVLVLGERLGDLAAAGGVLVVAGLWMTVSERR